MKKIVTLILISLFVNASYAQVTWCVPSVIPYGPTTPGITEFRLNTIDRVSPDLESSSSNYEFTGLSTTLVRGQTYSVSITHTVDASICPDMNLRVWLDLNINGDLDDNGETVISTDHHAPGTYTATFTVPMTASLGTTRLRATAKMSNLGGHTLPTPCNIPPDPIGYHGEVEDYTVIIADNTGISDVQSDDHFISVFPNPATELVQLSYSLPQNESVQLELYNFIGKRMSILANEKQVTGNHDYTIDVSHLSQGSYLIKLTAGNKIYLKQLLVSGE